MEDKIDFCDCKFLYDFKENSIGILFFFLLIIIIYKYIFFIIFYVRKIYEFLMNKCVD